MRAEVNGNRVLRRCGLHRKRIIGEEFPTEQAALWQKRNDVSIRRVTPDLDTIGVDTS